MKIRKKLLSLLGAAAMAVTVMAVAGGAQEVKAASNTYVVNSSVADVTGNVGDTNEVPSTFTTDTPTNTLLGKLRDNKNNVTYYDDTVLKFVGTEFRGMPAGLTSTAGGNFSYVSTETSTSGTIILKFEVLKCSPTPVTLNIKDLYYTTNAIKTDTVNLTSKITINHPTDKRVETVTKEPTCTEKGTKSVKCGECGADLGTEEIPALGHTAGDWKVTKEATCTEKGSKKQLCSVVGPECCLFFCRIRRIFICGCQTHKIAVIHSSLHTKIYSSVLITNRAVDRNRSATFYRMSVAP